MSKTKSLVLAAVTFALGLIVGLVVNFGRDALVDSLRRENHALRELTATQQAMIDEINELLKKP